jgi:hypothetical protein
MTATDKPSQLDSHELAERLRGLRGRFDEFRGRL